MMNSEAVSMKSLKNRLIRSHKNRILKRMVRVFHLTSSKEDELTAYEVQICNMVAWAGAIVVTAVVLRSLYLMYMKPDGY